MPRLPQPIDDPVLQAKQVVRALVRLYPTVECALVHRNPYELLVATILSAQCTDARVNMVTPALFARFPDPRALAKADLSEVEELIHSTGFFRAKAKNLVAMANLVVALHAGEIPSDLDALTALPGVGRKTAHVVLGNAFAIASGVVVDTHVKRLSFRLGLTTNLDPIQVERDLAKIIPRKEWVDFSHRLIEHGRRTCVAIRPRCGECAIASICPKLGVTLPTSKRLPK
ncbi:endonuclease III [Singulisphaera sp. Ch08]|uniref:Endonuclease III n=1 Tax=Singulisphaera sp. Ch08 TaxID=3120278 RepID=A0AAU7CCH6_9BACT